LKKIWVVRIEFTIFAVRKNEGQDTSRKIKFIERNVIRKGKR